MCGVHSESTLAGAYSNLCGVSVAARPFRHAAPFPLGNGRAFNNRSAGLQVAAEAWPADGDELRATCLSLGRGLACSAAAYPVAILARFLSAQSTRRNRAVANQAGRVRGRRLGARPSGRASFHLARSARRFSAAATAQPSTLPPFGRSRASPFCLANLIIRLRHTRLIYGDFRFGRASANGKPFLHSVSVPSGCEQPSPLTKRVP